MITNHYLSLQIYRPPPILIIHLTRFKQVHGGWVKHQSNIDYPLPDVGKADLTYWELLGGLRTRTTEQSASSKKINEVYQKQEQDWENFKKNVVNHVRISEQRSFIADSRSSKYMHKI